MDGSIWLTSEFFLNFQYVKNVTSNLNLQVIPIFMHHFIKQQNVSTNLRFLTVIFHSSQIYNTETPQGTLFVKIFIYKVKYDTDK